jgi:hypothetical protein
MDRKWRSEPAEHLIAQNYSNFGLPVRNLAPGVSIINFHYAYPDAVETNYALRKAIGYDETGFLGQADEAYLGQAWNFLLSAGSLFNHLDYSFSRGHEGGSDVGPNGPGGGSAALRKQIGILSRFLHFTPGEHGAGHTDRTACSGSLHQGAFIAGRRVRLLSRWKRPIHVAAGVAGRRIYRLVVRCANGCAD